MNIYTLLGELQLACNLYHPVQKAEVGLVFLNYFPPLANGNIYTNCVNISPDLHKVEDPLYNGSLAEVTERL